jgi:hypothetical protein
MPSARRIETLCYRRAAMPTGKLRRKELQRDGNKFSFVKWAAHRRNLPRRVRFLQRHTV